MELILEEKKKVAKKNYPRYKVTICFMEGDADGSQTETIEFKENDVDNLKRLVLALECCNAAYPNGRGGYDEYNGLPEYDAFFSEDCDKAVSKKLNPDDIYIEHPSDSNYISTSFNGYNVIFIDENGNKTPVKFEFNEAEKARIKECEKFDR